MGWQDHRQTNFACNSIGPNFNKPRKRCNSNDANSIFEQAAGELHAKLLWPGRRRSLASLRDDAPSHPSAHRAPLMWRAPEGPEGLAGLRDDAPSEARGADDSRAGRRPRAHKAARPHSRALRRPEHPWGTKQPGPSTHTKTPTRNRVGASEPPVGIEPTTYSLRVNRSAD